VQDTKVSIFCYIAFNLTSTLFSFAHSLTRVQFFQLLGRCMFAGGALLLEHGYYLANNKVVS